MHFSKIKLFGAIHFTMFSINLESYSQWPLIKTFDTTLILTIRAPYILEIKIKINLNFYFHTPL